MGLILLIAAGLKLHALLTGGVDPTFSSPRWQIAAIQLEVILGLWLLSGFATRLAWATALALFGMLTVISFHLGLIGQSSCGCLGRLELSPWTTFGIDVVVVGALLLLRPTGACSVAATLPGLEFCKTLGGACAILLMLTAAFVALCKHPDEVLQRLRGEAISISPLVARVGAAQAGTRAHFSINLTNHARQPVRIVGGTTSCTCTTTGDLPITLAPGERRPIRVEVTFKGTPGTFQHSFSLYTDVFEQPVVVGRFAGMVLAPPSQ